MAKDEAKKRVGTDDILAVCLKDNAKVIGELIYDKGEFDAMEIGFFFKRNLSGEPIWADTCLYGILKDEWE